MLFLLIKENLEDFKNHLRAVYPEVKSSHLSEAIARGMSYNTNASLLVDFEKSKKPKITVCFFESEKFFSWLAEKGYSLNEIEFNYRHFGKLRVPPYLVHNGKGLDETHFDLCLLYSIPMIDVHLKRKYATVNWNCITINGIMKNQGIPTYGKERIKNFLKNLGGCRKFDIDTPVGSVEIDDHQKAEKFASFIFYFLHETIEELPPNAQKH